MTTIVPRWEWRTFGGAFEAAEAVFATLEPGPPQDSDETYFLAVAPEDGPRAADSIKVRFELLDIKVLREVDPTGLERWEPVLKTAFPISAADARRVFEGLHVAPPAMARDTYTQAEFLAEVVEPSGTIRAVPVHKRRVRYTLDGCSAELSEVTALGRTTRTIAVESVDAAAVRATVRRIGLDAYLNTNYPRGLAYLLADLPARVAVIDAGTNSTKFHVAERVPAGGWRTVADRAEITRLGEASRRPAASGTSRSSGSARRSPGCSPRDGASVSSRWPRSARRGCVRRPMVRRSCARSPSGPA